MKTAPGEILLGDIGGTNARFTFLTDNGIGPIDALAVKDFPQFTDAVAAFLARQSRRRVIGRAVFAAAGPVTDGRCRLTNSSWVIDTSQLRRTFKWAQVRVVNDFEAIAWSLPHLVAADLVEIGNGKAVPDAPVAVLGPGTGLGLACRYARPDGEIVISSEGGHATLPGTNARDDAVIAFLRLRFGHVSAERALSGDGLVNLYHAIGWIDHRPTLARSAADVTAAAFDGSCPICRDAVDMFCAMLGTVAGNAALTFAARGGVYIAGGIVPRIIKFLTGSQFRARFEAKGRFQRYLAAIPTQVIIHPEPTLVGLQWLGGHGFTR